MSNKKRLLEKDELDFSFYIKVNVKGHSVSDFFNTAITKENINSVKNKIQTELSENIAGSLTDDFYIYDGSETIDFVNVGIDSKIHKTYESEMLDMLKRCLSQFEKQAEMGMYPEFLLQENGGNGLGEIKELIEKSDLNT